jgi:hypothetical protein
MPKTGKKSRMANKDDFLGLNGLPFEDIPTPEFGENVVTRVKALDALRGLFARQALDQFGDDFIRPVFVAACVVDENEKPVFSFDDVPKLAQMDMNLIIRLSDAAFRVEDLRRGKRAEVEQNFEKTQA